MPSEGESITEEAKEALLRSPAESTHSEPTPVKQARKKIEEMDL